jgi:hypothetical protein
LLDPNLTFSKLQRVQIAKERDLLPTADDDVTQRLDRCEPSCEFYYHGPLGYNCGRNLRPKEALQPANDVYAWRVAFNEELAV